MNRGSLMTVKGWAPQQTNILQIDLENQPFVKESSPFATVCPCAAVGAFLCELSPCSAA